MQTNAEYQPKLNLCASHILLILNLRVAQCGRVAPGHYHFWTLANTRWCVQAIYSPSLWQKEKIGARAVPLWWLFQIRRPCRRAPKRDLSQPIILAMSDFGVTGSQMLGDRSCMIAIFHEGLKTIHAAEPSGRMGGLMPQAQGQTKCDKSRA
jgi:hypothetical protein